jgi:hypothetical protein
MAPNSRAPKKQRQSLLFSVKSIFKSKPHTGAGPAPKSPWSNQAERPATLTTIHKAVRDDDIFGVDMALAAYPQNLTETDDRNYSH